MSPKIRIDRQQLSDFCQCWKVAELSLFGSVLREDFRPGSDVDVLVEFLPEAKVSLFDLMDMAGELEQIFGRRVDLVPKDGLKPRIRQEVLGNAQVVYAAAA